MDYLSEAPRHTQKLFGMYTSGQLKIALDTGAAKPFKGLEQIADAIDVSYSLLFSVFYNILYMLFWNLFCI